MTKKEFIELLDKFEKGECSEEEQKVLFKYCESIQISGLEYAWDLTEREEARIRLFARIQSTINETPVIATKKVSVKKIWYAAAAVLLLIASGSLYWRSTLGNEIPANAITLELEDGSIQIIEENGTNSIVSSQGVVLGTQTGNSITYTDTYGSVKSEAVAYNTLRIPYGKIFNLQLSDGTKVHLNAGSSLRYPVQFSGLKNREVTVKGEAYLEVTKDSLHPFIVNANNLNVRVLGTSFNVSAYPEDEISEVVLVEGLVGLYTDAQSFDKDQSEILHPGFKASFTKADQSFEQSEVLTSVYTSWMHGEMVFRNMSFSNILKKLERKYDVQITNTNEGISKVKFNASFGKNASLEEILSELKTMYDIQYTMKDNLITIN
ncbi:FecR family protein [Neptunitalea lumnitzerae]|uniref:Iron dicitrate transporter FecR n=1 Tax=Neptunitalea lumnitzerae TaxID=2965509 RepID=A0ABQ5MLP9_9FLAO|nr:FecR family protein [Neptunitalea sp. Y10]GLB50299.1 iron dicitrate transporter FecR [Neptunitalea sp. Y10]